MNEAVAVDELGVAERIPVRQEQIAAFCRKWQICEFTLFGSVLRDDFRENSDVDVMVEFDPSSRHTLFEFFDMQEELKRMFGRPVDLVQKSAVTNPFVRHHIRHNRQVVFRAS
ncbi:MAG TPA: nucleotidyltransferase family protein [Longimicrobium sp.]|nr:nucleotidyltransferase family protein [Longimicrobium sp.]